MAAQESQPETVAPSYMVNGKDFRKQMVITDDLRGFIGDVLAVDIELDKDDQQYSKVLCPPRTRGRPEDMQKLADFLMTSSQWFTQRCFEPKDNCTNCS